MEPKSNVKKNQKNQNSNWKKLLGFRNMQEKLENVICSTGNKEIAVEYKCQHSRQNRQKQILPNQRPHILTSLCNTVLRPSSRSKGQTRPKNEVDALIEVVTFLEVNQKFIEAKSEQRPNIFLSFFFEREQRPRNLPEDCTFMHKLCRMQSEPYIQSTPPPPPPLPPSTRHRCLAAAAARRYVTE